MNSPCQPRIKYEWKKIAIYKGLLLCEEKIIYE